MNTSDKIVTMEGLKQCINYYSGFNALWQDVTSSAEIDNSVTIIVDTSGSQNVMIMASNYFEFSQANLNVSEGEQYLVYGMYANSNTTFTEQTVLSSQSYTTHKNHVGILYNSGTTVGIVDKHDYFVPRSTTNTLQPGYAQIFIPPNCTRMVLFIWDTDNFKIYKKIDGV